MSLQLIVLILS